MKKSKKVTFDFQVPPDLTDKLFLDLLGKFASGDWNAFAHFMNRQGYDITEPDINTKLERIKGKLS